MSGCATSWKKGRDSQLATDGLNQSGNIPGPQRDLEIALDLLHMIEQAIRVAEDQEAPLSSDIIAGLARAEKALRDTLR